MSTRAPIVAILNNEVRVLRANRAMPIMLLGMPLIIIAMLRSTMQAALSDAGIAGASGAEQVVPGQALLFGFFMVSFLGNSFFREHGWFTWDRLRTSRASRAAILIGKSIPWMLFSAAQLIVLLFVGCLLFGLEVPGAADTVAIIATAATWALFVGAFSLAAAARLNSMPAVSAVSNLGAMFFSSVGGAVVPVSQLPGWAAAIGPLTPTCWAMRSFNSIWLDDPSGAGSPWPSIGVLLAFAGALGLYAWFRFDFEEPKRSWV